MRSAQGAAGQPVAPLARVVGGAEHGDRAGREQRVDRARGRVGGRGAGLRRGGMARAHSSGGDRRRGRHRRVSGSYPHERATKIIWNTYLKWPFQVDNRTRNPGAPRRRPRRRLDDVRRPQILRTTVELIRERGLWEVRLSDVAERAGISATSVVYYFGTKDQLFAEAIHVADEGFYEPLAGAFERHPSRGRADRAAAAPLGRQRLAAVDRPVGVLPPPSRDGRGAAPLPRALADDDRGDRALRLSDRRVVGVRSGGGRAAAVGADRRAGGAHGARRLRAHAGAVRRDVAGRGGARARRRSRGAGGLGAERPGGCGG